MVPRGWEPYPPPPRRRSKLSGEAGYPQPLSDPRGREGLGARPDAAEHQELLRGGVGGMLAPSCRAPGPVTSTRFQQRPLQPPVRAGAHQTLLSPLAGDQRQPPPLFAPFLLLPPRPNPTFCLNQAPAGAEGAHRPA